MTKGQELRTLRRKHNLTQNEVAAQLGHSSNSYISQYESGVRGISPMFEFLIVKAIHDAVKLKEREMTIEDIILNNQTTKTK